MGKSCRPIAEFSLSAICWGRAEIGHAHIEAEMILLVELERNFTFHYAAAGE